jgi:hypothetical protein
MTLEDDWEDAGGPAVIQVTTLLGRPWEEDEGIGRGAD